MRKIALDGEFSLVTELWYIPLICGSITLWLQQGLRVLPLCLRFHGMQFFFLFTPNCRVSNHFYHILFLLARIECHRSLYACLIYSVILFPKQLHSINELSIEVVHESIRVAYL